jgi:hypothetical protein
MGRSIDKMNITNQELRQGSLGREWHLWTIVETQAMLNDEDDSNAWEMPTNMDSFDSSDQITPPKKQLRLLDKFQEREEHKK